MSVKPELAFDVCWEVYCGAREVLESKRGISALNWKDTGKFLCWRDARRWSLHAGLHAWFYFARIISGWRPMTRRAILLA